MVGFRTALIPRRGLPQFLIPTQHRSTVYSIYLMAKNPVVLQTYTRTKIQFILEFGGLNRVKANVA